MCSTTPRSLTSPMTDSGAAVPTSTGHEWVAGRLCKRPGLPYGNGRLHYQALSHALAAGQDTSRLVPHTRLALRDPPEGLGLIPGLAKLLYGTQSLLARDPERPPPVPLREDLFPRGGWRV